MISTAKIVGYDGTQLTIIPTDDITMELLKKHISVIEIVLNDGRIISAEQRKKVFAVIRDISLWCGHEPEYIRKLLTWDFRCNTGMDDFSLSTVNVSTAKDFINYLIEFCFYQNIPTKDTLLNQNDDIGKYLYLCLEHRKCAVCNAHAEIHHVDKIGMGRDREQIVHIGLKAIALCSKHHTEAHYGETKLFDKYHIYGVELDDYLCGVLKLNIESRR